MSDGPLDGLLVVAVEQAVAAPLATARMVDAGARVIKVERPDGDFARGYDRAVRGDSSYFAWANAGKESIALDLRSPDDAAVLERLVGAADVVVQNLAPGALSRLGFGGDRLRAEYPRLITCDVSGYGESAELAGKKAYDLLVQAESGMVAVSGGPGELGRIGISICDIGTGVTAYTAVLEALIARATTGRGTGLKVSLFDVAAEWMTVPYAQHVHGGQTPTRVGLRHPSIAPYGAYETSDGALTLISVQNEREWVRLCTEALDRPDLAVDERFVTNTERVRHRHDLEVELGTVIGGLDSPTFRGRLDDAGIAFGAVSSLDDLANHPSLRTRTIETGGGSAADLPAHPVRRLDAGVPPTRRVPTLDEHGAAIRAEFAG